MSRVENQTGTNERNGKTEMCIWSRSRLGIFWRVKPSLEARTVGGNVSRSRRRNFYSRWWIH